MKEFEYVYSNLGHAIFIHYNDEDENYCTIDINGMWHTVKTDTLVGSDLLKSFESAFNGWYIKQLRKARKDYNQFSDDQLIRKFNRKQLNEKWGVYVDFSININYAIHVSENSEEGYLSSCFDTPINCYLSIDNARRSAIIRLITLYNQ